MEQAAPSEEVKRTRNPYTFVVVYDTQDGLKIEECPSRPMAEEFVNALPETAQLVKVYRASETIHPKRVFKL